jgi:predicted nucleic acid-binding Zn ribbon protein
VPVARALDAVTRELGSDNHLMLRLLNAWESVVGPVLAAHTRPLGLSKGTLSVAVDQPGWATEVSYLEGDLCRRVREVLGVQEVERLAVRVRSR